LGKIFGLLNLPIIFEEENKMQNTIASEFFQRLHIKENSYLDMVLIIFGSLFVGMSSQFAFYLPFSPVPITGQTFAVLFVGAILGSRRGGVSLALYLLEGIIGLPVFAGGKGGLAVLFGPTAGYLIGFMPAAILVGYLAEKGFDRNWISMFFVMVLGSAVIYLFGVMRLLSFFSFEKVFLVGVVPFLLGDFIKIGMVMALIPTGWKLLNKSK
jgi:biotin transport system substrate-specific component